MSQGTTDRKRKASEIATEEDLDTSTIVVAKVTWKDLPWTVVAEHLPGLDVARLQQTCKSFSPRVPSHSGGEQSIATSIEKTLQARLQADTEVGQPLLRRHRDMSLARLAHCLEYVPQVGQGISIWKSGLLDDPGHPVNVATRDDLHKASEIFRSRSGPVVLFVIDGVVVLRSCKSDNPAVVRISLPHLLEIRGVLIDPPSFMLQLSSGSFH